MTVPTYEASDSGTALRSFNRFELKYLVERSAARRFRDELAERMRVDPHQPGDAYRVRSVYYDTRDLVFYWEKIEGLRFRRKVRIRHYGHPHEIDDSTDVFVEIKQRVNKVTQKRRAVIAMADARALVQDGQRRTAAASPADERLLGEVAGLVETLDLRPTALVAYWRDALIGDETEPGLRVTFDSDLRVRGDLLELNIDTPNRVALDPDMVVVELKVNERVPHWLTQAVARHQLTLVRVSKYCQSIEVLGRAPRSVFNMEQA